MHRLTRPAPTSTGRLTRTLWQTRYARVRYAISDGIISTIIPRGTRGPRLKSHSYRPSNHETLKASQQPVQVGNPWSQIEIDTAEVQTLNGTTARSL